MDLVAAVVFTVSVTFCCPPEATCAWFGFSVQVGGSVAVPVPWKATEQVRFTAPENPPVDPTWIEAVPDPPAELIVMPLLFAVLIVTEEPLPLRGTDCGEPDALSVMVTAPVRFPAAVGVNVTEMVQLPAGATLVPHVLV